MDESLTIATGLPPVLIWKYVNSFIIVSAAQLHHVSKYFINLATGDIFVFHVLYGYWHFFLNIGLQSSRIENSCWLKIKWKIDSVLSYVSYKSMCLIWICSGHCRPSWWPTCIRCITCLLRSRYIDSQQIQLLKNKKNEKSNKWMKFQMVKIF